MSCCEYRWYDGQSVSTSVSTYKIEWTTPAGDQGGWFLFYTRWAPGAAPLSNATGNNYNEQPFFSEVMQRLRQITGLCGDDIPFTKTLVTVTPASVTAV